MDMTREQAALAVQKLIEHERREQTAKHGNEVRPFTCRTDLVVQLQAIGHAAKRYLEDEANLPDEVAWMEVFAEELGECIDAEMNFDDLQMTDELVSCCAVLYAWLEHRVAAGLVRQRWGTALESE